MFLDNFDLLILKIFKKKHYFNLFKNIYILKNNFQCITDMNNKSSSELQGFYFSS